MRPRETSGQTLTPEESAARPVHCQMALGLTQEELGALLGKTKRTIQPWQEHGFEPMASQAETLARALQPVRPVLTEQVLELGRKAATVAGLPGPARPATAEVIDAILRTAADAGGTSPEAIRPALTAALQKAEEIGAELRAPVAGLKSAT